MAAILFVYHFPTHSVSPLPIGLQWSHGIGHVVES